MQAIAVDSETGPLLTVDEVARELRLSRGAIYRKIANRQLRALALGSGPKAPLPVRRGELERFLAAGEQDRVETQSVGAARSPAPTTLAGMES